MRADAKPRRRRRRFRLVRSAVTRLSESVGSVRHAIEEPRSVPRQARDTLLRLWRIRGGGFYGLGYVVTFVVLEVHAFLANWVSANDIVGMVVQEVLQFLFRFTAQSVLNGIIALAWPFYVLKYLGGFGLVVLGLSWWLFDRYARPWIVARLPEPDPPAETAAHSETGQSAGSVSLSESPPFESALSRHDSEPLRSTTPTAAAPPEPAPDGPGHAEQTR